MDRDLTMMIYGAIMGVIGSIVTSLVAALFQFWLERREYERRQSEAQTRQLRQIRLPTDEEVILLNTGRNDGDLSESQRHPAGSLVLSVVISSLLVYQTHDPILGFAFAAVLGFLMTRRLLRLLGG